MFKIPDFNLPYAEKRINQLNKVCSKLGLPEISMEIKGEVIEIIGGEKAVAEYERRLAAGDKGLKKPVPVRFLYVELINAVVPKISGWSFAAVISHEMGGNVFRVNPNLDIPMPERYRNVGAECEHCNLKRDRKDSYILLSESGEWKQVGRSCLKDFLGHANPESIALMCEHLFNFSEVQEVSEESWGGGSGRSDYVAMAEVMLEAARIVRVDGYKSQKMAEINHSCSSAQEVRHALYGMPSEAQKAFNEHFGPILDVDRKVAAESIEWAKALPVDAGNDYLWNLRVLGHSEFIKHRSVGLAVSILVAADKDRLAKLDFAKRVNEWYGVIGDKVDVNGEYRFHAQFDSQWGVCHIHSFLVDGHELVWKSSKELPDINKGDKVNIKAKIKAHSMYKDKKQSMLDRAKVERLNAAA